MRVVQQAFGTLGFGGVLMGMFGEIGFPGHGNVLGRIHACAYPPQRLFALKSIVW